MKNKSYTPHDNTSFWVATLSILSTFLVGFLLSYFPDVLDVQYIQANFIVDISNFVAEKSEMLQYMICTILFPLLYISFHFLLNKTNLHPHIRITSGISVLSIVSSVVLPILLVIGTFAAQINHSVPLYSLRFMTFTATLAFCTYLWIAVIGLYEKYEGNKPLFNTVLLIIVISFAIFFTSWYITSYSNGKLHHFEAYFYPIYKTYVGLTPFVDFRNIYGFYPYIFAAIFDLFGGISLLRMSLVIAFIVLFIFGVIIYILFKLCKSKIIAAMGSIVTMILLVVLPAYNNEYYLQYFPHRVLFPVVTMGMCVFMLNVKTHKYKTLWVLLGYAIQVVALIWNFDTGIVCLVGFFLFNCYLAAMRYSIKENQLFFSVIRNFLYMIAAVASCMILLLVVTYLRTNQMLVLSNIFFGQSVFYSYGFYMLKMPLLHPWIAMVSLYACALIKALRKTAILGSTETLNHTKITRYSMYFLFAILGMGIFSYYQGRSHQYVFIGITWLAIIVLTIFIDEYFEILKNVKHEKTLIITTQYKYFTGQAILIGVCIIFLIVYLRVPSLRTFSTPVKFAENVVLQQRVDLIDAHVRFINFSNYPKYDKL